MIRYCIDKWEKNKDSLQNDIRENQAWKNCNYLFIVKSIVAIILNDGTKVCSNETEISLSEYDDQLWNTEKITEIDNGHYSGTLLYLIPRNTDEPMANDYLMGFFNYGSCSICDTLERIQDEDYESNSTYEDDSRQKPSETQVKDYMTLCKDFICSMVRPYNNGWRKDPEFDTIEEPPL